MAQGNFNDQLNNISRKRAFAEMLRKQGQELSQGLGQTQMVSGRAVPNSGWGSANAIISQLLGTYMDKKMGEKETETKEKQRADMKEWAQALMRTQEEAQFSPVEQGPQDQLIPQQGPAGPMSPVPNQPQQQLMPEMAPQSNEVYAQPLTGNDRFAHLLAGLDKGGYAAQIAGSQLSSMMAPPSYETVGRGASLINPATGEVVYTNPNTASGQNINIGGATDIMKLAETIQENNPNLTWSEALQQASAMAAGGSITGQQTPVQPRPTQPAQAAPAQADEAANPMINKYIRGGELTGTGKQVFEKLVDPKEQKTVSDAAANNALLLQDVELIAEVVDQGGWVGGPILGMDVFQGAQLWADQLGWGSEKASEVRAALRRLQTAGKIQMIDEAGGVRAFDTVQEMNSLFESLANEKMTEPTLLDALGKFRQRAYRNIETAEGLSAFVDAAGGAWAYPFNIDYPAPYQPKTDDRPPLDSFRK